MKIITVEDNSLAQALGLKPGDSLLKINGQKVRDELDYQFRFTEEMLTLELEIDGLMQVIEVEKDYDEPLGVEFEELKIRSCANDCVFCFVDQNPQGMRQSMYFRDGDYRLSYLHGHYVTMTNMGQNDLKRVVEQKLSPLYVSVHVTDPVMREKLFLYKKQDNLLDKIKYLTDNGIELHTQIVLMPDLNDGKYLQQTLKDLYRFYPKVKSVSIVPVGLTGHRDGLMSIKSVDRDYAIQMLNQQDLLRHSFPGGKIPFIYLSDEWYILAGQPFPSVDNYLAYDLIENGVGQVPVFLKQFESEKKRLPARLNDHTEFSIVTGVLVNEIFQREVGSFLNNIENLKVNIIPVQNDFFGRSVTVTGLLTGQDIINQLKGRTLGQAVWCTDRIINDEGTHTLDDLTLADISKELGVPMNVSRDSISEIFKRGIHG